MERKQMIMTTMDVLMYLCMFVLMQIIAGLLVFVGGSQVMAVLLSNVLILGLFLMCKWASLSMKRVKNHTVNGVLLTILLGLSLVLPAMWFAEVVGLEMPEEQAQLMTDMMKSPLGVVSIVLLAPFIEELVFRGAILNRLKDVKMYGGWLAIAISALLFGIIHGNIAQGTHAVLVGLLMGWLYMRTRSILLGVIIHLINNTTAYLAFAVSGNPDLTLEEMFGGNGALMYSVLAVSTIVAVGCLYKIGKIKLTK